MKVLQEHLLLQMGHMQCGLRSYPVMAASGYMEGGHKMGPGSKGSSWRQWCL